MDTCQKSRQCEYQQYDQGTVCVLELFRLSERISCNLWYEIQKKCEKNIQRPMAAVSSATTKTGCRIADASMPVLPAALRRSETEANNSHAALEA